MSKRTNKSKQIRMRSKNAARRMVQEGNSGFELERELRNPRVYSYDELGLLRGAYGIKAFIDCFATDLVKLREARAILEKYNALDLDPGRRKTPQQIAVGALTSLSYEARSEVSAARLVEAVIKETGKANNKIKIVLSDEDGKLRSNREQLLTSMGELTGVDVTEVIEADFPFAITAGFVDAQVDELDLHAQAHLLRPGTVDLGRVSIFPKIADLNAAFSTFPASLQS